MKFSEVLRGWSRRLLAIGALATLASCGGGTEHIDPFVPAKIVAFGDESSVIESSGRKYSVNSLDSTTGALVCAGNPIWVQYLASSFGMGFSQCPGGHEVRATSFATFGAKVADVTNAVQNYIANNTITSKDLFTVYVGQNDVIGIFEDPHVSDKVGAAGAAGQALANVINTLGRAGGRVLFVLIPDVGLTPYALQHDQALIKLMSAEFNTKLARYVINDGHVFGLVSGEEMTQVVVKNYPAYGFVNATQAACINSVFSTTAVGCDGADSQLVEAARPSKGGNFYWAGDRNLGPAAHLRLGQIADTRARNNPF